MAISFYAVYQFVTNSDRVWIFIKPYEHRGSGTYISPNNLGRLPGNDSSAGPRLAARQPRQNADQGVHRLRVARHPTGLAVTVSRGGWLSAGVSLVVFFALLFLHRSYRLPAAVLLAGDGGRRAFISFPAPSSFRLASRSSRQKARSMTTPGSNSGDRRSGCGRKISGGGSARTISIAASARSAPRTFSANPIACIMIT